MGNVLNVIRLFLTVAGILLLITLAIILFLLPIYVFWQFTTGAYSFEAAVVALLTILCYSVGTSGINE